MLLVSIDFYCLTYNNYLTEVHNVLVVFYFSGILCIVSSKISRNRFTDS